VAERRAQLEGKIRDLENRQAKLLDAVGRGAVSDRVARRRSDEHEAPIREARGQIEVLGAAEYMPSLPDLKVILELAGDIPAASQSARRKLLVQLATGVRFDPPESEVQMAWRFGGHTRLTASCQRLSFSPACVSRSAAGNGIYCGNILRSL